VSRPTGLPLVVAALPEHQAVFRAVSRNAQLVEAGVEHSLAGLSDRQLLAEAWKCVEPRYLAQPRKMAEDFEVARARARHRTIPPRWLAPPTPVGSASC
jgi:hypothetical protein